MGSSRWVDVGEIKFFLGTLAFSALFIWVAFGGPERVLPCSPSAAMLLHGSGGVKQCVHPRHVLHTEATPAGVLVTCECKP